MARTTQPRRQPLLSVERLEDRLVPAVIASEVVPLLPPAGAPAAAQTLTKDEVRALLQRAAAATASNDAIIAVVDRNGRVLGVATEQGVDAALLADPATRAFAVDGALALARTGALFGNDQSPLTSRTIRDISQTTVTEREVNSNPNDTNPNSTSRGPGFVAPVGIGGHFPPNIPFTPQVDLFGIEHTNRDSLINPGADHIKGTPDDQTLSYRFNIDTAFVPAGQQIYAPESYGYVSGTYTSAQSRGIATLPGGIPIFKNGSAVGGIGVFFPGKSGYATEENSGMSSTYDPTKPDRSIEAEFMAFAAVGGSTGAGYKINDINGVTTPPGFNTAFDLPFGRIDLVGITLDIIGPGGNQGPENLVKASFPLGFNQGSANVNFLPVTTGGDLFVDGRPVPAGWLVLPQDGVGISAAEVRQIIEDGISEATRVRSAIRLPNETNAKMTFAVADKTGKIIGLYRMPDGTVFSIDVAVAKARNLAYYNDAAQLQPGDQLPNAPAGAAFTNRAFRYSALPRYPEGIEGKPPGPFSQLNDPGNDNTTGLNTGAPIPASQVTSVFGYDAFYPNTNFHAPTDPKNQNGVVFFPGSTGIYKLINGQKVLVGGYGVSGDGVDEDDTVATGGIGTFDAPQSIRNDTFFVSGVRLPYAKFKRNTQG